MADIISSPVQSSPVQSSPVQSSPVQSIIIPTYNRKEMLAEAIMSVLKQSQKSLELIVVDDCSTDGTEEYVRSISDGRIRYFRNEKNSGQEFSRREGFRHSHGKYITFLDDDDYYTDYDFYAKAVKIHEEHENDDVPVVMVCANGTSLNVKTGETRCSDIGRPGRVKGLDYILKPEEYKKPHSTFPAVFRADALRRAGFEDMIIFDTMTYIEAALEGDAWYIPDNVGVYRIHGGNKTFNKREERHFRIARENIRRTVKARDTLRERVGRKKADSWHISQMTLLSWYYAISRPGIRDRLQTLGIILSESGFMPKLWLIFTVKILSFIPRKIFSRRKS